MEQVEAKDKNKVTPVASGVFFSQSTILNVIGQEEIVKDMMFFEKTNPARNQLL